jgi:hypothetical protein
LIPGAPKIGGESAFLAEVLCGEIQVATFLSCDDFSATSRRIRNASHLGPIEEHGKKCRKPES